MARKAIQRDTQTAVLVESRRRCCICYGLDRDTALKAGQIGHLDRDPANSNKDNLAFLCFVHHDEYDTKTSQRKNFQIDEVKVFREELHRDINKQFSVPGHFGRISIPPTDPYAGQYIRVNGEGADLTLTPLPDDCEGRPRYAVTGFAVWGTDREYGPNMGGLAFTGAVNDNAIEEDIYYPFRNDAHRVKIEFDGDAIILTEENWFGIYGHNVTFAGEYRKA